MLCRLWSTRRADITKRQRELAREFTRAQGRPPTPVEAVALAQQANLETRQAKHEPRSEAEQRGTWLKQATDLLGPTRLDRMINAALDPPAPEQEAGVGGLGEGDGRPCAPRDSRRTGRRGSPGMCTPRRSGRCATSPYRPTESARSCTGSSTPPSSSSSISPPTAIRSPSPPRCVAPTAPASTATLAATTSRVPGFLTPEGGTVRGRHERRVHVRPQGGGARRPPLPSRATGSTEASATW